MIGMVGINHKTAPVAIRERLVFSETDIGNFARTLNQQEMEYALLSTCNRTELYFYSRDECREKQYWDMVSRLKTFKGADDVTDKHFYSFWEIDAVKHLFRVASGLDSLVIGENQILGQVKTGYKICSQLKLTGTVLNRLFHKAFEAGKKVRTETTINEGASSVSYAAVELASQIFENLSAHPVLLIGAGETGELVLQSLTERGAKYLHVINRTFERAESLARKYSATAHSFDTLQEQLLDCDIIIVSTASKSPLITSALAKRVMKIRKNKILFLIDLSVPRNIEDSVKRLENVFLFDIDDLDTVVVNNREKRKKAINKANKIVEKIADDFFSWQCSLKLGPTIESLKNKFQSITSAELHNLKNKITENEFEKVSVYSGYLQRKYLGLIIKNLKTLSENGNRLEYVDLVNDLFELDPPCEKEISNCEMEQIK